MPSNDSRCTAFIAVRIRYLKKRLKKFFSKTLNCNDVIIVNKILIYSKLEQNQNVLRSLQCLRKGHLKL